MLCLGEDMRLPQEQRGLRLGEGSVLLGEGDRLGKGMFARPGEGRLRLGEGRLCLGKPVTVLRLVFIACLGSVLWPSL